MSKRTVVMSSILAAILMATVMTGTLLARGPQDPEGTSVGVRINAAAPETRGFVDEEGDGVPGLDGDNFVDADGDGLCDNCGDADCTPGTGENAVRQGGRWSR